MERMQYNCNACGMYVTAGDGHSCYTPKSNPNDKRIAELQAENVKLQAVVDAAKAALVTEGRGYSVMVDATKFDALKQAIKEVE